MRCYFMRDGHFGAVEVLPDASDAEAIQQAETLFEERKKDGFTGFEVWDCARLVRRHPEPVSKGGEAELSGDARDQARQQPAR